MQDLQLRTGISFGRVDGTLIFLDLRQDRYFALRGEAADLVCALVEEPARSQSAAEVQRLLSTGLFEPSDAPSAIRPAPSAIPERSLLESPGRPALDLVGLVSLTARLIAIRRSLKSGGLFQRVQRLAVAKAALVREAASDRLLPLALRFNGLRPLVPVMTNCLSDSLAMAAFLLRRGTSADLVFGVKLMPFAAHAWLQTDALVLNDHVDHVHEYTPVLVL